MLDATLHHVSALKCLLPLSNCCRATGTLQQSYYFTDMSTVFYFKRNSTELWNGLGQSHIQALALAQDINTFFLVLLFGKLIKVPNY